MQSTFLFAFPLISGCKMFLFILALPSPPSFILLFIGFPGETALFLVVVAFCRNHSNGYYLFFNGVNQSVKLIYSSAPKPGKVVF